MNATARTISVAEARDHFSKVSAMVVESGESMTVFKNSKPWVVISPAPRESDYEDDVNYVLERGGRDLAEGRYSELDEFLSRHQSECNG